MTHHSLALVGVGVLLVLLSGGMTAWLILDALTSAADIEVEHDEPEPMSRDLEGPT